MRSDWLGGIRTSVRQTCSRGREGNTCFGGTPRQYFGVSCLPATLDHKSTRTSKPNIQKLIFVKHSYLLQDKQSNSKVPCAPATIQRFLVSNPGHNLRMQSINNVLIKILLTGRMTLWRSTSSLLSRTFCLRLDSAMTTHPPFHAMGRTVAWSLRALMSS